MTPHALIWLTRYHPHSTGSGGGLLVTFVQSLVSSLGWHAGTSLARLLGGWLLVLALVAVVAYLARAVRRWRRPRHRSNRGRRSGRSAGRRGRRAGVR
jgi:hypothetical protein